MKGVCEMKDAIKLILKTILKFIVFVFLLFIIVGIAYIVEKAIWHANITYLRYESISNTINFLDEIIIGLITILLSGYVAYKFKFIIFKKGAALQNVLSGIFILFSVPCAWIMDFIWGSIYFYVFFD